MIPKRTKYPKFHKGRISQLPKKNTLAFGNFGLMAMEAGRLTTKQFAALIFSIKIKVKKQGKIILRPFAHQSVTKKPNESRMGKGKGSVDHWVAKVRRGAILVEVSTENKILVKSALKVAGSKLPIKVKLIEMGN